jgi:hypothetical protein
MLKKFFQAILRSNDPNVIFSSRRKAYFWGLVGGGMLVHVWGNLFRQINEDSEERKRLEALREEN